MELRPATAADAAQIAAIYNAEVLTATSTFALRPRSIEEQAHWIVDHSGAYPAVVALVENEIVGFGSLSPYRQKYGYKTTVEDSVYIREDYRGQGVGSSILEELIRLARANGFTQMVAFISDENPGSATLHTKAGFEIVGHHQKVGRKFGRWLDVTILQREL